MPLDFLPPPSASAPGEFVYENAWPKGERFDLFVYITDAMEMKRLRQEDLVWTAEDLEYGDWKESRAGEVHVPLNGRQPADLWAHVYLARSGDRKQEASLLYQRQRLGGRQEDGTAFWYPELDISLMSDTSAYDLSLLHPVLLRHLLADHETRKFHPPLYLNDFWHTKERRMAVEAGREEDRLPLRLSFGPLSLYRLQMLLAFDHSFRLNAKLFDEGSSAGGGGDGFSGGLDGLKEGLRSTAPWLLFLTLAVSLLHTLFDLLAFKNDIQFWRHQEDLTGLSVRTVLLSAASQTIILLYLAQQGASRLVLLSTAAGLGVEVWKAGRIFTLGWRRSALGVPVPTFRLKAAYRASDTNSLDDTALRWLSYAALPLLLAYSAYTWFKTDAEKRSLYAWLLSSLVGFVYAFGFIMMTPQLFINYKLKSVAHLPWRVFVYKALNTFIDDLFAFIIKMPLLHRLACFRDDIVFLVYLYQRWVYPVDRSRANEFGQTFADKDEGKEDDKVSDHNTETPKEDLGAEQKESRTRRRKTVK